MHRNRSWSFASPLFRLQRNRIIDINGYIPALDLLVWQPSDVGYFGIGEIQIPLANPLTIRNSLSQVQFKWDIISGLSRSTAFFWKKNNGSFVAWTRNTFNGVSFTENDTLTVAITTNQTANFTIALSNNYDGLICSTPYSINILPD
jgi:hypothetical protein